MESEHIRSARIVSVYPKLMEAAARSGEQGSSDWLVYRTAYRDWGMLANGRQNHVKNTTLVKKGSG